MLDTLTDDAPRHGHNSGDPLAVFEGRIAAFLAGLDIWAKRETLDADLAGRARDFIAGAKKLRKEADETRAAVKKPHADAASAVDRAWKPLLERLDKCVAAVNPKLESYLRAEKAKAEAAERAAREERARVEREAEAARMDVANARSESQRILAEERVAEVEQGLKAADHAIARAAAPVRVESATGLAKRISLRRQRTATLTSLPLAVSHFKDNAALRECLEQLANAELRAAGIDTDIAIPGFAITTTEKI